MRGDPAFGAEETEGRPQPKRFQFSLGTMLAAVLYAGLLATLTVNLAGKEWSDTQVAVAYFVTIGLVAAFAVMSKARGKVAAYLLLAPLIFVAAVITGTVFGETRSVPQVWTGPVPAPMPATTGTGTPTASQPRPPTAPPVQRTPLTIPNEIGR